MIYDKFTPVDYLRARLAHLEHGPFGGNVRRPGFAATLGLTAHANERCEGFSRGMRQKVALAGALIHDPKLLILDEPLTGLDAPISTPGERRSAGSGRARSNDHHDNPHP